VKHVVGADEGDEVGAVRVERRCADVDVPPVVRREQRERAGQRPVADGLAEDRGWQRERRDEGQRERGDPAADRQGAGHNDLLEGMRKSLGENIRRSVRTGRPRPLTYTALHRPYSPASPASKTKISATRTLHPETTSEASRVSSRSRICTG